MLLMPDITSLKRTQALHGTILSFTAGLITGLRQWKTLHYWHVRKGHLS